jgi:hypothetical protein
VQGDRLRAMTQGSLMTPKERRDIPWIVGIGVATCLIIILIAAFYR